MVGVADPPELLDCAEHFGRGHEFNVVAVYYVKVVCLQPLQAAGYARTHPLRGVVELGSGDAADFCEEEVGRAWEGGADERGGKSCAEETLGRTVVGRSVEGANAVCEGVGD